MALTEAAPYLATAAADVAAPAAATDAYPVRARASLNVAPDDAARKADVAPGVSTAAALSGLLARVAAERAATAAAAAAAEAAATTRWGRGARVRRAASPRC